MVEYAAGTRPCQGLFQLGVAAHFKVNLPETECDITVAWIQLARPLKIGQRGIPAVFVPADHRLDHKRFGIIRQFAMNDCQLVTCSLVIINENASLKVTASQLQVSLAQIWTQSQRGFRSFLC